ncbi:hypothetical protein BN949_04583 [Agrobacterium tumefaciens]|nr:hypothetical protein RP007_04786 [Rhizobium sp. P007]CDN95411.1 hypothetical protein BN949_04583 [Agrobacterium tumefaciens]
MAFADQGMLEKPPVDLLPFSEEYRSLKLPALDQRRRSQVDFAWCTAHVTSRFACITGNLATPFPVAAVSAAAGHAGRQRPGDGFLDHPVETGALGGCQIAIVAAHMKPAAVTVHLKHRKTRKLAHQGQSQVGDKRQPADREFLLGRHRPLQFW